MSLGTDIYSSYVHLLDLRQRNCGSECSDEVLSGLAEPGGFTRQRAVDFSVLLECVLVSGSKTFVCQGRFDVWPLVFLLTSESLRTVFTVLW